jgi:hypothetical protein
MTTQPDATAAAALEACSHRPEARSVAMESRTTQRAAKADAARAREFGRVACGIAQDALDQVEAVRFKLCRTYALLRKTPSRPHAAAVRDLRREDR